MNKQPPTTTRRIETLPGHANMSMLKSKKKPELQALAGELGLEIDGSKSDLEARILLHLAEHSELQTNPKFSKYFASILGTEPPSAVAASAVGSHKRRAIVAKKSTDMGDAKTRFVFPSFDLFTFLFMPG